MAAPSIVYVTGWGRSGTTVLNRVMSGPAVIGVGELRWLWRRGVVERQSCSCGNQWDGCPLWEPTVRRLARDAGADAETFAREADRLGRRAAGPWSLSTSGAFVKGDRARYVDVLRRLYETIAEVADARVVVDTSKHAGHAVLARETGLNAVLVHLVRDPRAVVWSHHRRRDVPEGVAARSPRPHPAPYVAVRWTLRNMAAELAVKPDLRVRYEDMVDRPVDALGSLWSAIGIPPTSASGGASHIIAGNLNRFDAAPLQLRRDDEWIRLQPRGQRVVTTLLALPLLRRYGYAAP